MVGRRRRKKGKEREREGEKNEMERRERQGDGDGKRGKQEGGMRNEGRVAAKQELSLMEATHKSEKNRGNR